MSITIIDKIDKAKDPNRKNQDLEFGAIVTGKQIGRAHV